MAFPILMTYRSPLRSVSNWVHAVLMGRVRNSFPQTQQCPDYWAPDRLALTILAYECQFPRMTVQTALESDRDLIQSLLQETANRRSRLDVLCRSARVQ